RVVEVLLPAAHAPDVQRGVPTDRIGRGLQVVTGHHRYGPDDNEAVEPFLTSLAARPDVLQLLSQIGGVVEDTEPAVGDLAGQLEVLRADRGQVDRYVVADRPDSELQCLARSVGQRQGEVLALVGDG